MSSEKQRIKEMKAPDILQQKVAKWIIKADAYRPQLIALGVGIFISIALVFAFKYWQRVSAGKRLTELANVTDVFEKETEAYYKSREDDNKKISSLTKEISELEKKDKEKNTAKIETLQKEKAAAEKALKDKKPQYAKSSEAYLAFYKQNSSYPEGLTAGMSAVHIWLQTEEYAKAADVLKEILAHSKRIPFYQVEGRSVYISVLEELKKFDEALAEAELLLAASDEEGKAKAMLTKAKIQILKGDKAEADKTLAKLIADHGNSGEASKAKALKYLIK